MKKMYVQTGKGVDEYYVNSLPKVKYEIELCKQKAKLFNKKYIDEETLCMCGITSFLRDSKENNQPNEYTVMAALLWSYDDCYKIKCGCSTNGSGFVSSLTYTICENDKDKDVVIIKKWGENIEDVHIYYDDLLSLVEQSEQAPQREKRLLSDIRLHIKQLAKIYVNASDKLRKELQAEEKFHYDATYKRFWIIKNSLAKFDKKLTRKCIGELLNRCDKDIEDYTNYKTVFPNAEGKESQFKELLNDSIVRKKFISDLLND